MFLLVWVAFLVYLSADDPIDQLALVVVCLFGAFTLTNQRPYLEGTQAIVEYLKALFLILSDLITIWLDRNRSVLWLLELDQNWLDIPFLRPISYLPAFMGNIRV
jgi:hypothetical protein